MYPRMLDERHSATQLPQQRCQPSCTSNTRRHASHHVARFLNGPTLPRKNRLSTFRMMYAIFLKVWRMLAITTPRRSILTGLTNGTWAEHMKFLMFAKTFKLEFDITQGVVRYLSRHRCMTYDFDVRSAQQSRVLLVGCPCRSAGRPRAQDSFLGSQTGAPHVSGSLFSQSFVCTQERDRKAGGRSSPTVKARSGGIEERVSLARS